MSFKVQHNFLRFLMLPVVAQTTQDPKAPAAGNPHPAPAVEDPAKPQEPAATKPASAPSPPPRLDDPFQVIITPLPENLLDLTRQKLGLTLPPGSGVDIAQATINILFVTRKMALPLNKAAFDPHEPLAFKTTSWMAVLAEDGTPIEFIDFHIDHSVVTGRDALIVDRENRGKDYRKTVDMLTLMVDKENEVPPFYTDDMVRRDKPKFGIREIWWNRPEHGEQHPDKVKSDYVFKMNPQADNVIWDTLGLAADNPLRQMANELSDKEITLSKGLPSLTRSGWSQVGINSLLDSGLLSFTNLSLAPALNPTGHADGEPKTIFTFIGNAPPEIVERARAAGVDLDRYAPSDAALNNAAYGLKELLTQLGKRGVFDTRMEAVHLDIWEKPKKKAGEEDTAATEPEAVIAPELIDAQPGFHFVGALSIDSPSRLELADRDKLVRACPEFANAHQNLREVSVFHTGPRGDGIPQIVASDMAIVFKPEVKETPASPPTAEDTEKAKEKKESEFRLSATGVELFGNIFAPATNATELGPTTFVITEGELVAHALQYDDITTGISLEMPQGIRAGLKRLAAGYGYGTCVDHMIDGIPAPKAHKPDANGFPDVSARDVPATIPLLKFTWKDPKNPQGAVFQGEIENFQYNAVMNDVHLPEQYNQDQYDLFGRSVLDRLMMNLIKEIPQSQLIDGLRLQENQAGLAKGTLRYSDNDTDLKIELEPSAIEINKEGEESRLSKPQDREQVTKVKLTLAVKSKTQPGVTNVYEVITTVHDLTAIIQSKFVTQDGKTELARGAIKDTRIITDSEYGQIAGLKPGEKPSRTQANAILEIFFAGMHQQGKIITFDRDIGAKLTTLVTKGKDYQSFMTYEVRGTTDDQGNITYNRHTGILRADGELPGFTAAGTIQDGNTTTVIDHRLKPILKDGVITGIGKLIDEGVGVIGINGEAVFKTSTKIEISVDGKLVSVTTADVDLWSAIRDGKVTVYKKDNGKAGLKTADGKDVAAEMSKGLGVDIEIASLEIRTEDAAIKIAIPGGPELTEAEIKEGKTRKEPEWHEIHLPFQVEIKKVALLDLLSDAPSYAATVVAGNKAMGKGIGYVFHKGTEDSAPFVVMNIEEIDSTTVLNGDILTLDGNISGVSFDTQSGSKKFHGVLDTIEADLDLTGLKAAIESNFDKVESLNGTFVVNLKGRDGRPKSVLVNMKELDEKKKPTDLMFALRDAYAKMTIDGKSEMLVKLDEWLIPLVDVDGILEGNTVHGTARLRLSDLKHGTVKGFKDWLLHDGKEFTFESAQGRVESTVDLVVETPEGEVTTLHFDGDVLVAIREGKVTVNEKDGKPVIQKTDAQGKVHDLAKDLSEFLGHSIEIKAITINTLTNNQVYAHIKGADGQRTWIQLPIPATTVALTDLVVNPQRVAAQMTIDAKGIHAYVLSGKTKNGSASAKDLDDKQPFDVLELTIDRSVDAIVFDSTRDGGSVDIASLTQGINIQGRHGSDPWGEQSFSFRIDEVIGDIDMRNLNKAIAEGKFDSVQGGFKFVMRSSRDPNRKYNLFAKIVDSQLPATVRMAITGNVTTGIFNPDGADGKVLLQINNVNDPIEMDAKIGRPGDEDVYHNTIPSIDIPTRIYRDGKIEIGFGANQFMSLFNTQPTRDRVMLQNGVMRFLFGHDKTYWKLTNEQKNNVDQLVETLSQEGFVPGGNEAQNLRAVARILGQAEQSAAVRQARLVFEADFSSRYADALTRLLYGPEFVQSAASGQGYIGTTLDGEAFTKGIPVRKATWDDLAPEQKEAAPRYAYLKDDKRKAVGALLQAFYNSGYILGGDRQSNLDALARFQFKVAGFDQLNDKQKVVIYECYALTESALPPLYNIKDDPTMDRVTKLVLGDEFARSKFGKEAFDLLTPAEQNQFPRFENLGHSDFVNVMNAATEGRVRVDYASTPRLNAITRMIYTADFQAQKKGVPSYYDLAAEQRSAVLAIAQKSTYVYHGDKTKNLAALAALFPRADANLLAKIYEYAEVNVSSAANVKFAELGFKSEAVPVVHAMPLYVERADFHIVLVPKDPEKTDPNHHDAHPDPSLAMVGTSIDFKGEMYHGPRPAVTKSLNDKTAFLGRAASNITLRVGLDRFGNAASEGKLHLQSGTLKEHLPGQIGAPDDKQYLVDYNEPAIISKPYDPDLPSNVKMETPENDGFFNRAILGYTRVNAIGVEGGRNTGPSAYAVAFIDDSAIRIVDVASLVGLRPLTKVPSGKPWTDLPLFNEVQRQSDNSAKGMIIGIFDLFTLGVDHPIGLADKRVNGSIQFTDSRTNQLVTVRVREGLIYCPVKKEGSDKIEYVHDGKAMMDENGWAKFIYNNQKYVWQFVDGQEDWGGHRFIADAALPQRAAGGR